MMTAIDYSTWPTIKLNTTSIKLDDKNPRLSNSNKTSSQRDIIQYLLNYEDIVSVARSIAYKGYFPDEIPVITEENNKKVVLEGNRRLAACKLLINPSLANEKYRKQIIQIVKDSNFNIGLIRKTKVLKAPNRGAADALIENRHAGVQIEKWDKIKQYRFYYLRILSGESIDELAEKFDKPKSIIRKSISSYYMYLKALSLNIGDSALLALADETKIGITNLERFYETKEGKNFLRIYFAKNGHYKTGFTDDEFDKRFTRVILDFLNKKLTSRTLNDISSRQLYLEELMSSGEFSEGNLREFTDSDQTSVLSDITDSTTAEAATIPESISEVAASTASQKRKAAGKKSSTKHVLIPDDFNYKTGNSRIDSILAELKSLDLEVYPNAVCVLFRSLLDMSISQLLIKSKYINILKQEEGKTFNAANEKKLEAAYNFLESISIDRASIDSHALKKALSISSNLKPEAPSLAKMLDFILKDEINVIDDVKLKDAFRPYYSKKSTNHSHWDFNRFVHNEYSVLPTLQEFSILWANACHFLEYIMHKLQDFNQQR